MSNKPEEIHCDRPVTELQLWEANSCIRQLKGEIDRHTKAMDELRKRMDAVEKNYIELYRYLHGNTIQDIGSSPISID